MSAYPKSHGLQGEWTEPDWPFLALEEVDAVLRGFPQARGAERILSVSPRPFSAAGIIATPLGRVFVKRHHVSVRDREGLLEEHRLLAWLKHHGAPVPAVLSDQHGETAIPSGSWTYEVHEVAPGLDVYREAQSWTPFLNVGHAYAAGCALARLHASAHDYSAPPRLPRTLVTSFTIFSSDDPMAAAEHYLASRPELRSYLQARDWRRQFADFLLPLHDRLRPWLPSLRPQWTHNDLHASNLLWSSDAPDARVTSIIDFGLSDRTCLEHDLATAIERNCIEWLRLAPEASHPISIPNPGLVHVDQVDALLAGYESASPLTSGEAHAVVALLPLVHAEFALSEADYFLRVLHSANSAALAYEGYCLAHARWFQSYEGQHLLRHLGVWADRPRKLQ